MANIVMLSKTTRGYFAIVTFSATFLLLASIASQAVYAAVPVEESLSGGNPAPQSSDRILPNNGFRTIEPVAIDGGFDNNLDDDLWGRSGPVDAGNQRSNVAGGALQGGSLSQMFYQMQVLQQEVQVLRGLAEEQQHLIENLRRDQKEQYVDLDGRVAALASNRPAPPPGSAGQGNATAGETPSQVADKTWTTEREAYTAAIELMRAKEFSSSIDGFEGLIVNFPNGKYTPNAFYWLGELYLALTETEKARQNFVQVVRLYPDHQKVPGALYKLGVLYHGLGDDKQAKTYLNKVQAEFPQSSAAKLASKYAQALN